MNLSEYQRQAASTSGNGKWLTPESHESRRLCTACLGLAGEAGEVVDLLKKVVAHGHPLDSERLAKELGDVLWYVAEIATAAGLDLSAVAAGNIAKLKARYPGGFSSQASQSRVDLSNAELAA